MGQKSKEEILAALVKEKTAAGLSPAQALEVAKSQVAHDESLAAADDAAEAAAEAAAEKAARKKGAAKA